VSISVTVTDSGTTGVGSPSLVIEQKRQSTVTTFVGIGLKEEGNNGSEGSTSTDRTAFFEGRRWS
jgi:hypothetical protein